MDQFDQDYSKSQVTLKKFRYHFEEYGNLYLGHTTLAKKNLLNMYMKDLQKYVKKF